MTYGKHFGTVIIVTLLIGGFIAFLIIRNNPEKFARAFGKKPIEEVNKDVQIQQLQDSVAFYRKIVDRYLEHQLNCVEFQVLSDSDSKNILRVKRKAKRHGR